MTNQTTNQQGVSMIIKQLMVTGSNEDPRRNDDWSTAYNLDVNKEYSFHDLVAIADAYPHQHALWVYEGEEYESKTTGAQYFYPWDTDNVKLVRPACTLEEDENDSWYDDWRREIAREEGMLQGVDAYNDWMGY